MTKAVDLIIWLVGCLPERGANGLAGCIGFLLHRVFRFRLPVVRQQMRQGLPHFSGEQLRQCEKQFYRHLGLLPVEMLRLPTWTDDEVLARTELHGLEHAQAALAKGNGAFILAAHLGNWEMGLAGCAAHGFETYTVTKEVKGRLGQYFIDRVRDAHQVHGIARRNSIRQIMKLLRENQTVGFVLDQNMTADEGIFVDFFDRPACTMPGLAVIARRTRAAVIPTSFHRDAAGRHHVTLGEPIAWEEQPGDAEASIHHNTQRYSRATEKMILEHPEQWLWIHKRWRTRPPVETGDQVGDR